MNLPNRLTVARFYLTAGFVASMTLAWRWSPPGESPWLPTLPSWSWGYSAGLVLFVVAALTDYLDGEIARSRNLVSDFGRLMDPLADKVMMAAAFICLIPEHAIPAWAAIVIISREFLITGLRLLAASKGVVLAAEKLGKHKTAWQMVTVIYFLVLLSLLEFERAGVITGLYWWAHAWKFGGGLLIAVAVALTLYSGLGYLWKHRNLIVAE
ncbi:MAG: CDP-diacylglycerol---glycerol-3-phosphate 3-phosphatidyltransferase [Chthoniobacter sp.]|jgi:CDP-diacylglycerol--glycerol-3-phosphate 3-phosphatidyltransferase|nr:CDP-diacylglycerol---glycerol-3-phosphate 3-phosphatidyltransferase [Chthoniobacter sp.]